MSKRSHLLTWPISAALIMAMAASGIAQDKKAGDDKGGDRVDVVVVRTGKKQNQQLVRDKDPKDIYSGIIPKERDQVKHLKKATARAQSGPNSLTWIGFKPETTRTRVFFQTARTPEYDVQQNGDGSQLLVTFTNTRPAARNFTRFINTSKFDRSVKLIETKRRRRNVEVMIKLVPGTPQPKISQADGYLYLDFSHTPKDDGAGDAKADDAKQ